MVNREAKAVSGPQDQGIILTQQKDATGSVPIQSLYMEHKS